MTADMLKAPPAATDFNGLTAEELLKQVLTDTYKNRIAVVSSFGSESAVLLHLVAQVDASTPVIMLETGKLFPETLTYLHTLQQHLGLSDVRLIAPLREDIQREDGNGTLWFKNPDACCHIRKVLPLERALLPFAASINGRKAFQSATRAGVKLIEPDGATGRVKITPLARWSRDDLQRYIEAHNLPRHPLEAKGYTSIGCQPCTSLPSDPNDPRSGRWAGSDKTECGIHYVI